MRLQVIRGSTVIDCNLFESVLNMLTGRADVG